jgi:DNA-binding response OmpR family regulator
MSAPRRVLIIDDSPLVLELTRSALESAGFAVATASTLDAFEAERARAAPDLILVDVQMPEAFGDDVAATLRGAYGVVAPILLLSSLDEAELAHRAKQAEATGWISKKAGLQTLIGRVRQLLEISEGT